MKKIIFLTILSIAIFFRFYELGNIPSHPSLDEVSIGYNAYSILLTGKDEYLSSFPVLLRAYDDYRPALYVYLVIPFVKFLGLSALAVRLPSVILSIISVISVYFLVDCFISKLSLRFISALPFLVMFLLAISPWHIYISRLGHEVNAFLSFFILGLTFFFKFILGSKRGSIIFLPLSAAFMALSFDSYQSGKIFIPLISLIIASIFIKSLTRNKKNLTLSIFLGLIIVLPVIVETLKPGALIRFSGTNILSSNPQLLSNSAVKVLEAKSKNDFFGQVMYNRRVMYGGLIFSAYMSHFNPFWLFTNTGDEIFKVPNFGLFYPFELVIILFGAFFLITRKDFDNKIKLFFLFWLLSSLVPGAITNGYPHAMRVIQILPLPQIVESYGIIVAVSYLLKMSMLIRNLIIGVFALVICSYVLFFSYSYFNIFRNNSAHQFQYGLLQAIAFAKKNEDKYNKIVVSNRESLLESYMFYLFSRKVDPMNYQMSGGTRSGGFAETHKIGKYYFEKPIKFEKEVLYVLNPSEFKSPLVLVKSVEFPTNKQAIIIGEVKP